MTRARSALDTDFASGAMLRLIKFGLQRQGITLAELHADHRSKVAITEKRAILELIVERFGAMTLLKIGEGLRDAPDEPALVALGAAKDPMDLLTRWQRLESYVHSRHRIDVEANGELGVTLRHRSLEPDCPPSLSEDLLMIGVLTALIETVLSMPLTVQRTATGQVLRCDGRWLSPPPDDLRTGVTFTWPAVAERKLAALPDAAKVRDAVRKLVMADAARSWTLTSVATELCLAPRTLQRRLREEGCSFAAAVLDARATYASRLLAHSSEPLATIGFVSGYADQSHFTRDFKRRTAMTPASYRSAFTAVPGHAPAARRSARSGCDPQAI